MIDDELVEDDRATNIWSVSSLKTIHSCGKQWEFRYRSDVEQVETPYLAFGSVVHKIIENIHKTNDFSDSWEREWNSMWFERSKDIDWTGYRKTEFNNRGPKLIGRYVDQNKEAKVLEVEYKFPAEDKVYKIGGFEIKGVIDQIRRTDAGRLLVIDIKTAKYPPDPLVLRHDPQLTFYYYVAREKYGEEPILGIYSLESNKILYTNRTQEDIEMVSEALREGQLKVDNNMFTRNITNNCKWCPFLTACLGTNEEINQINLTEL
ncbi:MAG TPA: PD-(D/E)XK nuclease family protein [Methylomirabilota bacterium]|nr:PD-(D/E)XK nuclease family protein [Methylomirabilota bacterium]